MQWSTRAFGKSLKGSSLPVRTYSKSYDGKSLTRVSYNSGEIVRDDQIGRSRSRERSRLRSHPNKVMWLKKPVGWGKKNTRQRHGRTGIFYLICWASQSPAFPLRRKMTRSQGGDMMGLDFLNSYLGSRESAQLKKKKRAGDLLK